MTSTRRGFAAVLTAVVGFCSTAGATVARSPRAEVVIHVDTNASAGGDGTGAAPFQNVPEAVAAARARFLEGASKLRIHIAPGVYVLTGTLLIDVPGLELRGSNEMPVDADGWPDGTVVPGSETRITPGGAFNGAPLIHVFQSGSELTGRGVTLADFTVDFNLLGTAILIEHVQGFQVKGCFVTRASPGGIIALASSGLIAGNYATKTGCGICVGGGNALSPAEVVIVGNRSVRNRFGGVLLDAGNSGTDETRDSIAAVVERNDLSDNVATPQNSFGIRIFTSPRGPFLLANNNHVAALIVGNRIRNNTIGAVIDAGWPHRAVGTRSDPRLYSGSLDVTFRDNDLAANLWTPALVTFTRNTAALIPSQLSPNPSESWKYLQNSVFQISDPQNSLAGYWLDHPETDPIDHRTLNNVLTLNGFEIPNGRTVPGVLP